MSSQRHQSPKSDQNVFKDNKFLFLSMNVRRNQSCTMSLWTDGGAVIRLKLIKTKLLSDIWLCPPPPSLAVTCSVYFYFLSVDFLSAKVTNMLLMIL